MDALGIINFPAFLLAAILLNLTPGSDTVYILARSVSLGRKAGVYSALGISTGAIVHTLAAACGLSAILTSSATLFDLFKYLGAMYLVYLGIKSFQSGSAPVLRKSRKNENLSSKEIYISGILTNVLNPKVALFFLAFLPQFISTDSKISFLSFIVLGSTFIFTGTIWCLCLAFFASSLKNTIAGQSNFAKILHKITGGVFIGLGVALAFSKR